ncbi:hypothetical protein BSKO_06540 [Bryopsis sp. KO-2023]|nr:hypothetical protein BSKO_06540 [Bryopsis sp. KO-2023]
MSNLGNSEEKASDVAPEQGRVAPSIEIPNEKGECSGEPSPPALSTPVPSARIERVEKQNSVHIVHYRDESIHDPIEGLGALLSKYLQLDVSVRKPDPLLETFDIEGAAAYLKSGKVKNIVCMCGAGISVSAGIPDFRSPTTGLYPRLKKMGLGRPEDVFSIDYFKENPEVFCELAKELMPGKFKPTATHHFMALLGQKGLLKRCYTQNIDSLETAAGLEPEKVVAAHGNFDSARCIGCRREVPMKDIRKTLEEGSVSYCADCGCFVKPDVVFFGEPLPERFFNLYEEDFSNCDFLIIMGSSLVVNPFASLVDAVTDTTPRLLINREKVGGLEFGSRNYRDAFYGGDCDNGVKKLVELMGWQDEFEAMLAKTS